MPRRTTEDLWDAIEDDAARAERERIESMSPEEMRRELLQAGFDLDQVSADAAQLAARLRGEAAPAPRRARAAAAGAERAAASRLRAVSVRVSWLLAAALALVALVLVWRRVTSPPSEPIAQPITPDRAPWRPEPVPSQAPPAPEDAIALRAGAVRDCEAGRWHECLAGLDRAKALDPGGEADPEVQRMRRVAAHALEPVPETKPPR
jgi:hypothetical protein